MSLDQLINVLVIIMLVEMMAAIGLGVRIIELIRFARDWRLVLKAGLANYICIPAITVGLLILVHPVDPMVPAGFLILAVCPGAPFGPPCTRMARGDVAASVGLMVILAGSSAIAAPVLLHFLLPLMSESESLQVEALKIVGTLLVTQLIPLCFGLSVRHWWPGAAEKLQKPANLVSAVLGLLTIAVILFAHFHLLMEIRLRGYVGMTALLMASWAVGWLLGGLGRDTRKASTLTASLRNVGVGLVIATGNFAGTAAVTATLAYGILEILGSLLLASWWGKRAQVTNFGSASGLESTSTKANSLQR
jgi:BASS family bile acid:Na+ symporter